MAKIFIEESTLSAIGNSIRAKTGRANMIPPLSMPAEIASIQTTGGGSGGGSGITYAKGTITPAENITGPFLIEHNLGESPSMFIFWRSSYTNIKQKNEIIQAVDSKESMSQLVTIVDSSGFWIVTNTSSGLFDGTSSSSYLNEANSKDLKLGRSASTLFAGNTYIWYAFLGVK